MNAEAKIWRHMHEEENNRRFNHLEEMFHA
jgi:hypothetical protein